MKRRNVLKGAAVAAACAALPVHAQHHAHAGSSGSLGTGAAVDVQGRLWLATVERDGAAVNIFLRTSADDGASWSAPRAVLRTPEAVEANGEGRPKLAFGPQRQVYISYTRPLGKPHTGDIRFVRSTDGGASFTDPFTVQRDRTPVTHRFDTLHADRAGRIYLAWIDERDAAAARAAKRAYRGAAIYYTVSTDEGASFRPDIKLADHTCECCRISLAEDAQGRVSAMWRHVFEPNVRDHAIAILSPTGTRAVVERATTDDWKIDACPHHGPGLAFDGSGRRHQVWFTGGDEGGVFYGAADGAGAPAKPVRLGGAQAEHADVAAVGTQVVAVWKEFDGEATRVTARVSHDGGRAWTEQQLARTKGSSDHPHLVQRGDVVRLVWRTADDGIVVRRVEKKA